jgi:hypothetical protein
MPHPSALHRPLLLALAAGAFAAMTLALGPSQPVDPVPSSSNDALLQRLNTVDYRVGSVMTALDEARREILTLRAEVAALTRQNADFQQSIKTDLAAIKAALIKPVLPPPPPAFDLPTDPLASPDAMLAFLRDRYAIAFADPISDNDRARAEHHKLVERWCRDAAREYRGKTRWLVRLESLGEPAANPDRPNAEPLASAGFTVLDATSRRPLSAQHTVRIPKALADRLKDHPPGTLVEVGLFLAAEPHFNPDRTEPNMFGQPVMVGPYAEHRLTLDWISVEPVRGSSRSDRPESDPPR